MNPGLIALIFLLSFIASLALGVPVAFSLFGIAMVMTLIFLGLPSTYLIFTSTFSAMTNDIFLAIPLFVFMSAIIQFSGIASALYDVMYRWFGGLRGGLAIATVGVCTLIAAMTGLGATGVVSMGVLALPEMLKRGYDKSLAVGCIPPGGALGPLIPPSSPMIVIAAFASLSVGKMFMGGVIPGLMIAFLYCVYIATRCALNPKLAPVLPPEERSTLREKFYSLRGVILPIILVIAVLGGIYSGAATPTEAAGVGALGGVICALIYRRLSWGNLREALVMTVKINTMVLWLLAGGICFGSVLSATGVSGWIRSIMLELPLPPFLIIVSIQLLGLIMGCFLDSATVTVIVIPMFMPTVISLGFDPLWFCILFSINLIIGYTTPPFGINLFYMKGIVPKEINIDLIYRSVTPYIIIDLIVMGLCMVFPEIPLWLPSKMK